MKNNKGRRERQRGRLLSITSRKLATCRFFIADADALVRAAVAAMVDRHPLLHLADELVSRDEVVAEVVRQEVEIVLLDLTLPPAGGLDALRRIRELKPSVKVVVMGEGVDDWAIAESIRLGARGVLSKDAAREMLLECLSAVYAGQYWVERHSGLDLPRMVRENGGAGRSNLAARLSQRERQVIGSILEGCTNRQIAEMIQTSEQVVKNHLSRIFDKVGVYNRLELALYALNHRLLTAGEAPREAPSRPHPL